MELVQFVAAMLASFLPARHWPRFTALPVERAMPVAAVAAFLCAGFLGVMGFISYSDAVMRDTSRLQMHIAERQVAGQLPESTVVSTAPMAVAMLAPLTFLFLTPAGQIAGYVGLTSLIRGMAWIAGEPSGDPVLGLIDRVFQRIAARLRDQRRRRARERLEGPEVSDRLYRGTWAGLPGTDFVVVCSRRKAAWTKGTTIVAGDEWFSLGEPFELHTADGLRTVYPLTRQREGDVVRHAVAYTLPPLRSR